MLLSPCPSSSFFFDQILELPSILSIVLEKDVADRVCGQGGLRIQKVLDMLAADVLAIFLINRYLQHTAMRVCKGIASCCFN
jgi:hypothetical protein